jgi:hypothetical protein
MANWDQAFQWQAITKDLTSIAVQRDELDIVPLTVQPLFYNAFGMNGTGTEVNPNQWGAPIVG